MGRANEIMYVLDTKMALERGCSFSFLVLFTHLVSEAQENKLVYQKSRIISLFVLCGLNTDLDGH